MDDKLSRRLADLEDERAVRELILRMAEAADRRELDAHLAAWADDAVYEMPGVFRRVGRDAIGQALQARWRGGGSAIAGVPGAGVAERHHVTGTRVCLAGDEATASSAYLAVHAAGGHVVVRASGVWHDVLARTPEGWKLRRRQILDRIG